MSKIASNDHRLFYACSCVFVSWPIEYGGSDSVSSLKSFAAFSMVPLSTAIMPGGHSHSPIEAYLERNWGPQVNSQKKLASHVSHLKSVFHRPSQAFSWNQHPPISWLQPHEDPKSDPQSQLLFNSWSLEPVRDNKSLLVWSSYYVLGVVYYVVSLLGPLI